MPAFPTPICLIRRCNRVIKRLQEAKLPGELSELSLKIFNVPVDKTVVSPTGRAGAGRRWGRGCLDRLKYYGGP